MKESNVDVLIIGAGPAGLMASNAFAAAGVNVRVVDKRCVITTLICGLDLYNIRYMTDQVKSPQVRQMVFSPARLKSSR